MSVNPTADSCAADSGCATAYEFVRLRYFFGQRLGVLELTDEQAYVVGKQRFHNRYLHGAGVLCGLRAERYAPAGEQTTTLLKVTRGAAIDACGREIIVAWDSCIDVAAWVRKYRQEHPDLTIPGPASLWVIVCYQECPSDPSPAPRDPCGCETTGCENSRVREGFRLQLVTESDLPKPVKADMEPANCPEPATEDCLVLARIDLDLNAEGVVTDLSGVEPDTPLRQHLWSVSAIQSALENMADAADLAATLSGGPRIGKIDFIPDGTANGGTLRLPVLLADDDSGNPAALLGDPLSGITFTLRQFDNGTWEPPLAATFGWDTGESRFELVLSGVLAEGRYRLVGTIADDTPMLDSALRELYPRSFARWFELQLGENGVLILSNPSS